MIWIFCYSYLSASMGCKLAALRAGYQPNMIPMAPETKIASRIDDKDIVKGEPKILAIINEARIPKTMPIIPPAKVSMIDSIRN